MVPPTKYSRGIIFLLSFTFISCNNQFWKTAPRVATYEANYWDVEDIKEYYNLKDEDSCAVNLFISSGVLVLDNYCHLNVQVNPPETFKSTKKEVKKLLHHTNDIDKILNILKYLYVTIPQLYLDPGDYYNFKYSINKYNILNKINLGKGGKLAATCEEYSLLYKNLWKLNKSHHKDSVIIKKINISPPGHTLNAHYIIKNNEVYGVIADAMYGYVYPIEENQMLRINDIIDRIEHDKTDDLSFLHIDDVSLHSKRFLTNDIWACNIVNDDKAKYFKVSDRSIRKMILRTKEDIRYIFPANYTISSFQKDLLKGLIENKP
jgi:hypothetical protein